MLRILVADRIAEQGVARLRETPGIEVDVRPGLSPEDLTAALRESDGVIIRSGVKITGDQLADPGKLRVIARAGVGVDNVDLPKATKAGVLVMNTPDANTVSTAEHTIAMILAHFRHIPPAHAHVAAGQWDRKQFMGRQVAGKTLGIVGFGRVGRAVAERALGLKMKVIAYDPLISADTAMDGKVTVTRSLDDLLPRVDCLTLHASVTPDSKKMIGPEALKKMKPGAVLVNCARGGLVDEVAVAEALKEGRLAGAAIDVYGQEPPKDCPLLAAPNVTLTPHLGASTSEAQDAVSTDAVESMLAYLCDGTIQNAVNVADLPPHLSMRDRSWMDLMMRMAAVMAPHGAAGIDSIEVTTQGRDALNGLCPTLALQAVVELMSPHIEGRLNLVNAADFARDRGIDVRHSVGTAKADFDEMVTLTIARRDGERHVIEGAVFQDGLPRIVAINGYRMKLVPDGLLVMILNDDRPGVIGLVGTAFGKHGINIADMFLSRREGRALMVLKIDGEVGDDVINELRRQSPPILAIRTVLLPMLPKRGAA